MQLQAPLVSFLLLVVFILWIVVICMSLSYKRDNHNTKCRFFTIWLIWRNERRRTRVTTILEKTILMTVNYFWKGDTQVNYINPGGIASFTNIYSHIQRTMKISTLKRANSLSIDNIQYRSMSEMEMKYFHAAKNGDIGYLQDKLGPNPPAQVLNKTLTDVINLLNLLTIKIIILNAILNCYCDWNS